MENERFHYLMGQTIGANCSNYITAVALRIERRVFLQRRGSPAANRPHYRLLCRDFNGLTALNPADLAMDDGMRIKIRLHVSTGIYA
jgi:hypothetical protein